MQTIMPHLQGMKKGILGTTSTTALLLLIFLLVPNCVWGKPFQILVVSSGNSTVYSQVVETIQLTISSNTVLTDSLPLAVVSALYLDSSTSIKILATQLKNKDIIVTVGQRALIAASQVNELPPTVATLIPKQTYDSYREPLRKLNSRTTAVYIDNPPERQIFLAKILLGNLQRLGVLVSNTAPYSKDIISAIIDKSSIQSHIEFVDKSDNMIRKLSYVLDDSDAFLALPDPSIVNRNTAKNILLTTYRQRTPVIAYSASYVKAGALAAVYSTPQQIAEQTGNVLIEIMNSNLSFPQNDAYPEDFGIAINKSVAKSLGIPTQDETEIKDRLLDDLRRMQ